MQFFYIVTGFYVAWLLVFVAAANLALILYFLFCISYYAAFSAETAILE